MDDLTPRERAVLDFVCTAAEEGSTPSMREIQDALNIPSSSSIHEYLKSLEEKGYVTRAPGKSRSVRPVYGTVARGTLRVPILGRVAAGTPILAAQNYDGYADLPAERLARAGIGAQLFALQVRGDSMIGDGIMDGDLAIVRFEDFAMDGDLVVVLVGEEATVKRVYREKHGFRLQPSNPGMQPIFVEEVQVLGRVVANLRYYC